MHYWAKTRVGVGRVGMHLWFESKIYPIPALFSVDVTSVILAGNIRVPDSNAALERKKAPCASIAISMTRSCKYT